MMVALRVELGSRDHPVGDIVRVKAKGRRRSGFARVRGGRRDGSIGPGPPAAVLAVASMAAIEGGVIALAGRVGDDEQIAQRAALGLLRP